jgi:hypothetical protein
LSGVQGGAKSPTLEACHSAQQYLRLFLEGIMPSKDDEQGLQFVVGPIPTGGVTVELVSANFAIHVDFLNMGVIEIQPIRQGLWDELFIASNFAQGADRLNILVQEAYASRLTLKPK